MNKVLLQTPVWQLNGEQLIELLGCKSKDLPTSTEGNGKKYAYGIQGIADTYHCSIPTANRIKASGKIDKAIAQVGRKIIIDVDLALSLSAKKSGGRK
jgi:hypothetical protein